MENKLFQVLKCPVCLDIPKHEIFQCKNGHMVCSVCILNLRKCPVCKGTYKTGRIRCLAAEFVLDEMEFDCLYKSKGCVGKVTRRMIGHHCDNCPFKSNQSAVQNQTITSENVEENPGYPNPDNYMNGSIICNSCLKKLEITRYKCLQCADYNLCETCFQNGIHPDHILGMIENQHQASWFNQNFRNERGWMSFAERLPSTDNKITSSWKCSACPNPSKLICLQCQPLQVYCEACYYSSNH